MATPTPTPSVSSALSTAEATVVQNTSPDMEFEVEPSPSLYCPICQDLFAKPVITSNCFHTFCRSCLITSLGHESTCPMCRAQVDPERLLPNLLVASIISDLLVRCRNNGCNWKGTFSNLQEHENGTCAHRNVRCIHHMGGCKWTGSFVDLPQHVTSCPFEVFKDYMKNVADEISGLKSQVALLTLNLQHAINASPLSLRPLPKIGSFPTEVSPRSLEATKQARLEMISRLECKHTKLHHTRNVTSLALGDRGFFFSASHDTAICMWDTESCELQHQFSGNKDSVWALAYMNGYLYSGSEGSLTAWPVPRSSAGSNLSTFQFRSGGESKTYCLVPDSRSSLLFSGNYKTIGMWDTNSHERVTQLAAHDDCVWTLAWLEDRLISGSDDGTVKVWDLKRLDAPLKTFEFGDARFLSVAAGGGYIFGGTQSGQTHVWSATTFEHVTSLRGHQWDVWQLSYINGLLCSGSYDHTIKIWDTDSLTCVKTLTGHRSNIYALKTESLDDETSIRLISGSGDKTIKIWEAPPENHRASASRLTN